jgi:hypothetical protein
MKNTKLILRTIGILVILSAITLTAFAAGKGIGISGDEAL